MLEKDDKIEREIDNNSEGNKERERHFCTILISPEQGGKNSNEKERDIDIESERKRGLCVRKKSTPSEHS